MLWQEIIDEVLNQLGVGGSVGGGERWFGVRLGVEFARQVWSRLRKMNIQRCIICRHDIAIYKDFPVTYILIFDDDIPEKMKQIIISQINNIFWGIWDKWMSILPTEFSCVVLLGSEAMRFIKKQASQRKILISLFPRWEYISFQYKYKEKPQKRKK